MQPVRIRLRGLQWHQQVGLLSTVAASTLFANSIKSFNLQANPLTSRNDISSLTVRGAASRAGNDASNTEFTVARGNLPHRKRNNGDGVSASGACERRAEKGAHQTV